MGLGLIDLRLKAGFCCYSFAPPSALGGVELPLQHKNMSACAAGSSPSCGPGWV